MRQLSTIIILILAFFYIKSVFFDANSTKTNQEALTEENSAKSETASQEDTSRKMAESTPIENATTTKTPLEDYTGDWANDANADLNSGGTFMAITKVDDYTLNMDYSTIQSAPANRIAQITEKISISENGTGVFSFDNDGWGNSGEGKIELLANDQIKVTIQFNSKDEFANWSLYDGPNVFVRSEIDSSGIELTDNPPEFSEDEIAQFMDTYFSTMVQAINERNINLGSDDWDLEGKAYPEFRNYLSYLEEKGITEEYLGMSLVGYKPVEGGYHVTTNEEYNIFFGDGTGKNKAFESKFFVSVTDEGLRLHTLLSTNETFSEDL